MLAFDAHLDLAWNAIDWNRDLLQPVREIRTRENASNALEFKAFADDRMVFAKF